MKKILLTCSLVAFGLLLQSQAGPLAGCFSITPPGSWSELLQAGQPGKAGNEISAQGPNYSFTGAKITFVTNDVTGEWDWLTKYEGGKLVLTNAPDAAWFAPCDGAATFEVAFPAVWVKTRSSRFASTNAGYLQFVLMGHSGSYELKATFSGMPAYTAQTNGDILASGDLASAKLWLGKVVTVQVLPNPFNVASKGVLPVQILNARGFNVKSIDLASLKLACVPASGWSFASGKLLLKFDRQALVANLGPVEDGERVSLLLTGQLKDGSPISGSDEVTILKKGKPAKPGKK